MTNRQIQIFGYPLPELRRIIYEYQQQGIDPKRMSQLIYENVKLRDQIIELQEALAERFR